jgi:uncharacterized Rmd1/YagE family protein
MELEHESIAPPPGESAAVPAEPPVEGAEVASEPEASTTPETADSAQDKPKSRFEKRIDELTWQYRETERALEAERQNRQKAEQIAWNLWNEQQKLQARATLPKVDAFQTTDDYERAVLEHIYKHQQQVDEAKQMAARAEQERMAVESQARVMEAAIAEGEKKYPDFRAKVNSPALPNLATSNPALLQALIGSQHGIDIAYHLASNPTEAHRIAALHPVYAIRELGRIEAMVSSKPSKSVTSAPPPVTSVASRASAAAGPSDEDSTEAWIRKRNAELNKRAKA